jgi:hypothetical protein
MNESQLSEAIGAAVEALSQAGIALDAVRKVAPAAATEDLLLKGDIAKPQPPQVTRNPEERRRRQEGDMMRAGAMIDDLKRRVDQLEQRGKPKPPAEKPEASHGR